MFPDGPLPHHINAAFYCCSCEADVSFHVFPGLELFLCVFFSFFFFFYQFMAGLWIEEVLNECFKIAVGKSHLATVKKTHFVVDSIEMQPRQIGFFLSRVYFPRWWFLRYSGEHAAVKRADMCWEDLPRCVTTALAPFMLWRNFSTSVTGGIYHFNPRLAQRVNVRVSFISRPCSRALKAREQVVKPNRRRALTCCHCSAAFLP